MRFFFLYITKPVNAHNTLSLITPTLTKEIVKFIASIVAPYGESLDGRSCGCGGCIVEDQTEVQKQVEVAEILGNEHVAKEILDDYFN
jgi:hypothetical protein